MHLHVHMQQETRCKNASHLVRALYQYATVLGLLPCQRTYKNQAKNAEKVEQLPDVSLSSPSTCSKTNKQKLKKKNV